MKKPIKPIIGAVALICAAIGMVVTVSGSELAEANEPTPPIEEKVVSLTVRIRDAVAAQLKDRDAKIESDEFGLSWHPAIPKAGIALAVLGLIGGAKSRQARKESSVCDLGWWHWSRCARMASLDERSWSNPVYCYRFYCSEINWLRSIVLKPTHSKQGGGRHSVACFESS
ncbi:MAG: hypothetical protein AAGD22_08785 [Verrucomicrobiota bacterium]